MGSLLFTGLSIADNGHQVESNHALPRQQQHIDSEIYRMEIEDIDTLDLSCSF